MGDDKKKRDEGRESARGGGRGKELEREPEGHRKQRRKVKERNGRRWERQRDGKRREIRRKKRRDGWREESSQ